MKFKIFLYPLYLSICKLLRAPSDSIRGNDCPLTKTFSSCQEASKNSRSCGLRSCDRSWLAFNSLVLMLLSFGCWKGSLFRHSQTCVSNFWSPRIWKFYYQVLVVSPWKSNCFSYRACITGERGRESLPE